MAPTRTNHGDELSPSPRHDVATLFARPGVSGRESVEGSALALLAGLVALVAGKVAVTWLRRRR
jgi:hypothetical protein